MNSKSKKAVIESEKTTGKGNPELIGESAHSTPGQVEGDRETVEESLSHHQTELPQEQ